MCTINHYASYFRKPINYDKTYLAALPKELILLLSSFFYDRLVICIHNVNYVFDKLIIHITIKIYDLNNRIIGEMGLNLPLDDLLLKYKNGPINFPFEFKPCYLIWRSNQIYITLESPNGNWHMNLYDHHVELFLEKLTLLSNELAIYQEQGLTIDEINKKMQYSLY